MSLSLTGLKDKLEAEKEELEASLQKIGRINPQSQNDWEVRPAGEGEPETRDDVADQLEAMTERQETERTLEYRLNSVKLALRKMEAGEYGRCEIGGEPIESERLEANPASRTCKAHREEK